MDEDWQQEPGKLGARHLLRTCTYVDSVKRTPFIDVNVKCGKDDAEWAKFWQ